MKTIILNIICYNIGHIYIYIYTYVYIKCKIHILCEQREKNISIDIRMQTAFRHQYLWNESR